MRTVITWKSHSESKCCNSKHAGCDCTLTLKSDLYAIIYSINDARVIDY